MAHRLLPVVLALLTVALLSPAAMAAEPLPLWPQGAPGAIGDEAEDIPSIEPHLPEGADEATPAIVVCPGGGYVNLALGHEGVDVAERLNEMGIAAFILRYRLAPRYRAPVPQLDARRAIRHVRHNAEQYNIDPDRLGVLGFSAGGHLTATTGTLIADESAHGSDAVDRESARPDFLVLCYPVINMTDPDVMHKGSRNALLGDDADNPAKAERYSLEKQVSEETPPTFLFHTNEDAGVPPENSVQFYLALREAGVPAEMHIYEPGRHGVGLAPDHPALSTWPGLLENWLKTREILPNNQ